MASRLLRGAGALAAQALSARGPRGVSVVRPMASGGGVPTDAERATGLQREVMLAARKGLDPYHTLAPKAASGTKEDPNLVRFITRKRMVGCICEEDSSAVIWLWLHKGEAQRGPSCGTHYKLVPYQLAHGAPALAPSKWDLQNSKQSKVTFRFRERRKWQSSSRASYIQLHLLSEGVVHGKDEDETWEEGRRKGNQQVTGFGLGGYWVTQREKPGSGSFSWESNGPLSRLPPTASTGNWGTHRGRVLLLPWQARWDRRCPSAALCLNQTCKLSSRSEMICHSLSARDLICHLHSQAETMLAYYANSSLWSSTSGLRERQTVVKNKSKYSSKCPRYALSCLSAVGLGWPCSKLWDTQLLHRLDFTRNSGSSREGILQEDAILQSKTASSPDTRAPAISLVLGEMFGDHQPKEKAGWMKLTLLSEEPET
eukprot:bmy_17176T0